MKRISIYLGSAVIISTFLSCLIGAVLYAEIKDNIYELPPRNDVVVSGEVVSRDYVQEIKGYDYVTYKVYVDDIEKTDNRGIIDLNTILIMKRDCHGNFPDKEQAEKACLISSPRVGES